MCPPSGGTVQTRAAWLAANTAAAPWKPLAARSRLAVQDFGAPPPPGSEAEDGTDLDGALGRALAHTENLKAALLLTDGDWNLGASPLAAATKYSARDIPIYAVGIGSETPLPDLILDHSDVPAYGLLGDQVTIPFRVRSHLPREVRTAVDSFRWRRASLRARPITIPAFGEVADSLVWSSSQAGEYHLSLRLPVEHDEAIADNNEQDFRIAIRTEKLKVLVVESAAALGIPLPAQRALARSRRRRADAAFSSRAWSRAAG